MIGLIVAMSPEGVIGLGGRIPWRYKGDLARFKRVTMGSTIVMGRLTWESIGRPLPGRRNVVITSRTIGQAAEFFPDVDAALATCTGDVWFIGGARVYAEAMKHVEVLDVTMVPDRIDILGAVRFPPIDPDVWEPGPELAHEDEPLLRRRIFTRSKS